jgi:hypothetical protein
MGRPPRIGRPFPTHADQETWLRRGEVARIFNVTRENVRTMESTGAIHGIVDEHGEHRFDPDEIYAYARTHHQKPRQRSDGELTALAFKMFEAGASRRQVVMKLRITVERADGLWEKWSTDDFETAAVAKKNAEAAAKLEAEERAQNKARAEHRKLAFSVLERAGISMKKE